MRASAVAGIVLANINDNLLKKLTAHRSMSSVPVGARYRLIDFALSNLVNAGVTNVGIITKENYRSLMDHVGSGIPWELDRKNGGLYLLPPYLTSGTKRYNGTVDALYGARDYIKRCKSDYVVLYNGDFLANVDISAAVEKHIENQADITMIYSSAYISDKTRDNIFFSLGENNRITQMTFGSEPAENCVCSIGVTVISRELLLKLVLEAYQNDNLNFNRDFLSSKLGTLKVYGFEHKEYIKFMSGTNSYYQANMDMLKPEIRRQLFNNERPILTKTRDDMCTRYGTKSKVKNSLIANGCVIEGEVENSILFRGVRVEKGAKVKNCILMQETVVGVEAQLNNVIADKNAVIGKEMVLKGTSQKHFFVKKNEII